MWLVAYLAKLLHLLKFTWFLWPQFLAKFTFLYLRYLIISINAKVLCLINLNERSSLIYKTSARHERHECDTSDTSATQTTRVRHEWKILILTMTRVKTYFHTLTFTIWQVKDYKERENFVLRITFSKCLFSFPKCV